MDEVKRQRPTVILDLGANNGSDIPYYLQRADVVVAVEANPELCEIIRDRFPHEITSGRLIVENFVITIEDSTSEPTTVNFYIHKKNHVLSQIQKPKLDAAYFERRVLPAKNILEFVENLQISHQLLYCKVDLEHFDSQVVKYLLSNGIRPKYLSAEVHSLDVFRSMVLIGGYNAFKLVRGSQVSIQYRDFEIQTQGKTFSYAFPEHSAGPFGDDVHGEWLTRSEILNELKAVGLGWKDLHATFEEDAKFSGSLKRQLFDFRVAYLTAWLKLVPRSKFWRTRNSLKQLLIRKIREFWGR